MRVWREGGVVSAAVVIDGTFVDVIALAFVVAAALPLTLIHYATHRDRKHTISFMY